MLAGGNTGRPNPHQGYQYGNSREYAIEKSRRESREFYRFFKLVIFF